MCRLWRRRSSSDLARRRAAQQDLNRRSRFVDRAARLELTGRERARDRSVRAERLVVGTDAPRQRRLLERAARRGARQAAAADQLADPERNPVCLVVACAGRRAR
jgi:hypothetical protein